MLFRKIVKTLIFVGFCGLNYAETSANLAMKRDEKIQKELEPYKKSWGQLKSGCGFYIFFLYRRPDGLKIDISYRYHNTREIGNNYVCVPTQEQLDSDANLKRSGTYEKTITADDKRYYQKNLIILVVGENNESVKSFEFKSLDDPVYDEITAKFSKTMGDGAHEKVAYLTLTKGNKTEHVVIFFNTDFDGIGLSKSDLYVLSKRYTRLQSHRRSDVVSDKPEKELSYEDQGIDAWAEYPVSFSFDPKDKKNVEESIKINRGTLCIKYDANGNPEKAGYSKEKLEKIDFVNVLKPNTESNNSLNAKKV